MTNYDLLNPILLLSLLGAGMILLTIRTLIVVISITITSSTALTNHVRAAMSAEQFGCKEVVCIGLGLGSCRMVMMEHGLYLLEKLLGDDRRDSIFDFNVLVAIDTDVLIVEKYRSQAILVELTTASGAIALLITVPRTKYTVLPNCSSGSVSTS